MEQIGDISYNVILPETTRQSIGGAPAPTQADPVQEGGINVNAPTQSNSTTTGIKQAAAVSVATSLAQKAANEVVSNIGATTGNYNMQASVQAGLGAVGMISGLVMSLSNPATAILSIGGLIISMASKSYQAQKQNQIENYTAAQNARRYGGFTTNGNR